MKTAVLNKINIGAMSTKNNWTTPSLSIGPIAPYALAIRDIGVWSSKRAVNFVAAGCTVSGSLRMVKVKQATIHALSLALPLCKPPINSASAVTRESASSIYR